MRCSRLGGRSAFEPARTSGDLQKIDSIVTRLDCCPERHIARLSSVHRLLEILGSSGVSTHLEWVVHILSEVGTGNHLQAYKTLSGKMSTLWARALGLFDNHTLGNRRVKLLHALLKRV